jgi:hypothetical protein
MKAVKEKWAAQYVVTATLGSRRALVKNLLNWWKESRSFLTKARLFNIFLHAQVNLAEWSHHSSQETGAESSKYG